MKKEEKNKQSMKISKVNYIKPNMNKMLEKLCNKKNTRGFNIFN